MSQSIHAPDTASHIIATSSNNDSTNPPSSTNVPPVVKVTSHKSHSLPTPAIAGIAIAIVLVTLIVGGVLLFLNLKKRRARHGQPQVELSAAPARPRDMAELGDQGSGTTDEKEAEKMVDEDSPKDQRLIDEREIALMDHGNGQGSAHELSGPDVSRPELPSPDPNLKFELASETVARSELSTPEPGWPGRELPTPEPVLETAGAVAADASSSPFDHNLSPVSSPGSTWSRNRTGSRRRPTHLRMDSSESEGPWPNSEVPTRTRPSLRHSRVVSSESEGGWPPDRMSSTSSRRSHARVDSSDSESVQPRANIASVQHPHRRNLSSDSEPISPQQPSTSDYSTRPKHDRFNSTDSTDTFETRLLSPGSPYFPPLRQPVQAIPSIGPDTASSAAFPTSRSGLLSEEPSDMNEVPKAMSQDPKKRT